MFKIIIVLAATFIASGHGVVTREFAEPLQGAQTYDTLKACHVGIFAERNKLEAAAGPRLKKFLEETSADVGSQIQKRGVFRVRCGLNAADTVDD